MLQLEILHLIKISIGNLKQFSANNKGNGK